MDGDLLLALVVAFALGFGFTNGVLDAPTLLSSLVSTRAISPRTAVVGGSLLNFAGAFLTLQVAVTLAEKIVDPSAIQGSDGLEVVLAGIVGAIAWIVATSNLDLPASSSHALIGGLVGATVVAVGFGGIELGGLVGLALLPAVVAPIAAFLLGAVVIALVYRVFARKRPGPVGRGFRLGQHLSGGLLAFSHGSNDAQKTMGAIVLALIANGTLAEGEGIPLWVVIAAAVAIALGTAVGSGRILGRSVPRIIKIDPAQGFTSEVASSTTILVASLLGFPLSTTQVMNAGVIGSGAARGISARRWGLARSVIRAWVLTFPAAAAIGALALGIATLAGGGLLGGLVALVVVGLGASLASRRIVPRAIRLART
ncbi:MAG: inorganic phosphate transporter [Solirubrobacterales bacterium]